MGEIEQWPSAKLLHIQWPVTDIQRRQEQSQQQ